MSFGHTASLCVSSTCRALLTDYKWIHGLAMNRNQEQAYPVNELNRLKHPKHNCLIANRKLELFVWAWLVTACRPARWVLWAVGADRSAIDPMRCTDSPQIGRLDSAWQPSDRRAGAAGGTRDGAGEHVSPPPVMCMSDQTFFSSRFLHSFSGAACGSLPSILACPDGAWRRQTADPLSPRINRLQPALYGNNMIFFLTQFIIFFSLSAFQQWCHRWIVQCWIAWMSMLCLFCQLIRKYLNPIYFECDTFCLTRSALSSGRLLNAHFS